MEVIRSLKAVLPVVDRGAGGAIESFLDVEVDRLPNRARDCDEVLMLPCRCCVACKEAPRVAERGRVRMVEGGWNGELPRPVALDGLDGLWIEDSWFTLLGVKTKTELSWFGGARDADWLYRVGLGCI